MASVSPVYFIGPESNIYHDDSECSALNNPNRYWSITTATGTEAIRIRENRRPCKKCTAVATRGAV